MQPESINVWEDLTDHVYLGERKRRERSRGPRTQWVNGVNGRHRAVPTSLSEAGTGLNMWEHGAHMEVSQKCLLGGERDNGQPLG